MIDVNSENLIALADVPAHLPHRRSGKKIHRSTSFRWAQRGIDGIRLEVLSIGGTKFTSLEALQRFFDRLSAVADGMPVAPQARTSNQRERAATKANDELARAGW